jgi:phosphoserine aminotransferase
MVRAYNFSPGPAMLPLEVMEQAQREYIDYKSGLSPIELSHRHRYYKQIDEEVTSLLIELLNIPKNYKIIWSTGGATAQFSFIPLNLLGNELSLPCSKNKNSDITHTADYLCTGYWSDKAIQAASKYININKVTDNKENNYTFIKDQTKWQRSQCPLYTYYTPNETISGLRFNYDLDLAHNINQDNTANQCLVADMTSFILSEPIDVSKYGIIFASAQKNLGPCGVTLIIVRDDLLRDSDYLPDIYNYKKLAETNSLLNSPPTYNMYIINLVLKWLKNLGGLKKIKELNSQKARKLYDYIDSSNFYINSIVPEFRSVMNVTFFINPELVNHDNKKLQILEQNFSLDAQIHNLHSLEGHRSQGGFRASIYNAMPMEGINSLVEFMDKFASKQVI